MLPILAAEFVGLVCRVATETSPSPLDLVELRRAIASRFAALHPTETLRAAFDRGLAAPEFQTLYAYATARVAGPLPPPAGGGGASGSRERLIGISRGERRAHISEIPLGVSRASSSGGKGVSDVGAGWGGGGGAQGHTAPGGRIAGGQGKGAIRRPVRGKAPA